MHATRHHAVTESPTPLASAVLATVSAKNAFTGDCAKLSDACGVNVAAFGFTPSASISARTATRSSALRSCGDMPHLASSSALKWAAVGLNNTGTPVQRCVRRRTKKVKNNRACSVHQLA